MGEQERSDLRVLVVGMSWPPETFLARLLWGLMDAGLHVTIAAAQRPDPEWRRHPRFSWLPNLRRSLPFAGRRWDVIYFPWNSAATSHLDLFDLGIPTVVSCRGSQINVAPHNPARSDFRDLLPVTFERAAAVHCVSQAIASEAEHHGLDPRKAQVIRPAVDADYFRPSKRDLLPRSHHQIVTTGNLTWHKGHEYALMGIAALARNGRDVRFEVIGGGSEQQRILYTAHDLGIQDRVRLAGHIPPGEVRDRLQKADTFLLTSVSEGISNAVLEAMACALPVVTTDCGGMREAITNGIEGLIVPMRDPDALAAALGRLVDDRDFRERMGRAGRERVLREFTLDHQIQGFVTLMRRSLVNKPSKEIKGS